MTHPNQVNKKRQESALSLIMFVYIRKFDCQKSKTHVQLVKNSKLRSGIINKEHPNQIKLPTSDKYLDSKEDIKSKPTFHSPHEEWDKKDQQAWQEIVS